MREDAEEMQPGAWVRTGLDGLGHLGQRGHNGPGSHAGEVEVGHEQAG